MVHAHMAILGLWWGKTITLCNFSIVGCQWTVNCELGISAFKLNSNVLDYLVNHVNLGHFLGQESHDFTVT